MKLVIQNMSRVWGGNEKWLSILAKALATKGHDVVVSCPRGPVRARLRAMDLRTTAFRPRSIADPLSGLSFAAWLRRERPDAVLMTSWHSVAWTTFAARIASVKRVVLRNGIVREAPSSGARSQALRHGVDALIVNAPEIRDVWTRSAPWFPPERVHIVLNSVKSRWADRDQLRRHLRSELGAGDGTLLVGSGGNLFRRKGFDILVRAFALASVDCSKLVIAGDGAQRRELERLSDTLGIADRVHWLGRRADAPRIIGGLDLFVLPSRNEGMANVMLEAMSAGVPVIASNISGVHTAIGATNERGPAGWIVDSFSDEAFASSIRDVAARIRESSHEVDARVTEAHWRIDNWFSRERMVRECEEILFGS